jgi:hypothetical protein
MLQERAGRRCARAPISGKVNNFFRVPLSSIIASHNVLSGRGEIVAHPAFELIGSVLPFGNERKYESPEVDPGFGTSC